MLDLEIVTAPSDDGLSIVSRADMKVDLRITHTALDTEIDACVQEAADLFHGRDGELNRTLFPTTYVRYLSGFPESGRIRLPYPPLIEVSSISYINEDGDSPMSVVPSTDYIVRVDNMIPEIVLLDSAEWPETAEHPRAVAVTYRAGYTSYPRQLKRLVKLQASHFFYQKEPTLNDRVQSMVSRKVEFARDHLVANLRVPVSYDDWED